MGYERRGWYWEGIGCVSWMSSVAATKKENRKWTVQGDASYAPTRVKDACWGEIQLKIDQG